MADFVQRTAAPSTDNAYYYADNPFYQSGYGMPNCTCYAWGRFWEISGTRPTLGLGNAEDWYSYPDGYERGTTPKLGAVLCWRMGAAGDNSDGAGHVEIVEQINADGTIITSGSAYNGFEFRRKTRSNDGNWSGGAYTFQGFIYNPKVYQDNGSGGAFVVPGTTSENRYLTSEEMHNNAAYIWWYLGNRGWTLNAVAGMLGNIEVESGINPGIWENLDEGNVGGGYGLVQWTPATKLMNWCSERGLQAWTMSAQLERIIWEQETENGQYTKTDEYPTPATFTAFKSSTLSPEQLAKAFLYNYEHPASPDPENRAANARYWYDYLASLGDITTVKRRGLPLILMYMASRRRF